MASLFPKTVKNKNTHNKVRSQGILTHKFLLTSALATAVDTMLGNYPEARHIKHVPVGTADGLTLKLCTEYATQAALKAEFVGLLDMGFDRNINWTLDENRVCTVIVEVGRLSCSLQTPAPQVYGEYVAPYVDAGACHPYLWDTAVIGNNGIGAVSHLNHDWSGKNAPYVDAHVTGTWLGLMRSPSGT